MAQNTPSMLTKITSASMLLAILSGGVWVGALATDVENLSKAEQKRNQDHDTLIELKSEQKTIKSDVSEIKGDVKDLDDKLDKILYEIRKQ